MTNSKVWEVWEYTDVYRENKTWGVNDQCHTSDVYIDIDNMTDDELKRALKKLFGLKRSIRLKNLWVDGVETIITLDYIHKGESVPIGYIALKQ